MARRRFLSAALIGMATVARAEPALTPSLSPGTVGAAIATDPARETPIDPARKLALLRQKIRYVFILFQENRSFDHYFGTYPGANGLLQTFPGADASRPATATPSYRQHIRQTDGSYGIITPFLAPRAVMGPGGVPVPLYPEDLTSVDHSHSGMVADLHVDARTASIATNDGYALNNEKLEYRTDASDVTAGNVVTTGDTIPPQTAPPTANPTLAEKQKGELVLAHLDCDTIPFLWQWADRFVLFDNLHQTIIGPSTPNAIAMISAQSGATQWALHPDSTGVHAAKNTVPNLGDTGPFAGSAEDDWAGKPPYGPDEIKTFAACAVRNKADHSFDNTKCPAPASDDPARPLFASHAPIPLKGAPQKEFKAQDTLTYASLPLSFMGQDAPSITARDAHPALDLSDIREDIQAISAANKSVAWGWYQQGFGPEPFDGRATVNTVPAASPHASYIVHHNGPQYFGYLGDNPDELARMHALQQFTTDVSSGKLPERGGVFFVRGGYYNNDDLRTLDPGPAVRATFAGNDDHGSYSDSQISEASLADSVNVIAASRYWPQSVIIITYDESDGFYDHAPEAIRNWGPDGEPMSGGPRIPAIVISPYAAAHTVSHVYSEHGSVIRFINQLFGLTPLGALPDEQRAQAAGAKNPALNSRNGPQTALGPNDGAAVGDLSEAFDNDRLLGRAPPIPPGIAAIPRETILSLPHYGGAGCAALDITPTDYPRGYGFGLASDPPPPDFNPRPVVSPGIPARNQTIVAGQARTPWTP